MKVLLTLSFPHHVFNAAVKDGSAGEKLNRIVEATKPESIYFTELNGRRGAIAVYELADGSGVPALCEPWMLTFEADIQLRPCMSSDDLAKSGLDDMGKWCS